MTHKIRMDERIREDWIALMESGRYKETQDYHCRLVDGEWQFAPTGLLLEMFQSEMREVSPVDVLPEFRDEWQLVADQMLGRAKHGEAVMRYEGWLWGVPERVAAWAGSSHEALDPLVRLTYAEACRALRETVEAA